ncbi:MAG: hypothetical protein ACYC5R_04900 [Melioribacteraceae bacterium]
MTDLPELVDIKAILPVSKLFSSTGGGSVALWQEYINKLKVDNNSIINLSFIIISVLKKNKKTFYYLKLI